MSLQEQTDLLFCSMGGKLVLIGCSMYSLIKTQLGPVLTHILFLNKTSALFTILQIVLD